MKKLTSLFSLALMMLCVVKANAEWKQVYKVDYSDYTSYPFYAMSGFTPQWVDGVMVDQGSTGWHQYFIADDIPTEVGGSYTVKAMAKASEEISINVNMGWGWNDGEQVPKDVTIGTEWQEVTWEYDNIGSTSCNLVAQSPKGGVTIEWKYLEVGYEDTGEVYTVAGTNDLTGYTWDVSKNKMKYSTETGLYSWVAKGITVKSDSDLAFKIVKDGNWATSWPESNWVINTYVTGGKGIFTITITFNAETKDISVTPVKTEDIVDTWTDIIVNGDMEGDNNECFYVTEQGIGGPFLANLTEGIGVDGSRGVRVESYDEPSADWDTQFFIRLPYQIPAGTKFKVSFDYKADRDGDFDTQAHTEPGGYIHYACVGSGTFTTEWQTYEAEGTVSSDMSKEDKPFQTISFNLAKNKVRTNFFFDNVKFEVPTEVLATLTKNPAVDPKPYTRPAYNSMVIVGDFLIGDDKWEPANGWEMEQDAENPAVWTLTKDFVAEAKTYDYKATANGKWGDYELPDKGNAEFNFDDPNLGAGAYSLTFTVDTRLHALDLSVKKLGLTTYTATFTTNADYWTDVYAYAWSGEEPNVKKFLGDWPGTKLTPDGAGVYTVSIETTDAPEKIIFNNGNSGEGNQTADFDFVNGSMYEFKAASGEEDPIKEAPAGWTNAVTNGNLAGDDVSSFFAMEYPSVVFDPAVIYAGAGTKGSRGILVKTADETEVSGATDWDSQFYIVLSEALPEGSKLHVEFDYKASENATVSTQSHGNPGAYQHWAAIGDVNFTKEWQTFSAEIEVNASMAKGDNGNGSGTGLKSICFNLAVNKHAVEYHFDNFGIWYKTPNPPQLVELPEDADVWLCTFDGTYADGEGKDYSQSFERQIAYVGDDIYMQGLSFSFPEAWIKGTFNKETGVATFPSGQYVGTDDEGPKYLVGSEYDFEEFDGPAPIVFNYEDDGIWNRVFRQENPAIIECDGSSGSKAYGYWTDAYYTLYPLVHYTVKYVDEEGNELKPARVGKFDVNGYIYLNDLEMKGDFMAIYSEDGLKKYTFKSASFDDYIKLSENEEENVITLTFNTLEACYATVNCLANGSYEKLATYEDIFFLDEILSIDLPLGLKGPDGKYYFTSPTSGTGGAGHEKFIVFPSGYTPSVRYGKTYYTAMVLYNEDATVAYYADTETLVLPTEGNEFGKGLGQCDGGFEFLEYCYTYSLGHTIKLNEGAYLWTEPIAEAGTYQVNVFIDMYSKDEPFALGYRDIDGSCYLYTDLSIPTYDAKYVGYCTVEGVSIPAGASLIVMNEKPIYESTWLDDIKIVKAGEYTEPIIVGVDSPLVDTEEGAIYNLAGQRMSKMQKGINIVGGKKILVK